jgi:hypothetical protein
MATIRTSVTVALSSVAAMLALAEPALAQGVPGPLAGAGLPFLLVGGAVYLVRRYRKRNRKD